MAADASIYAQFRQPVKSVADYMAERDQQEGNALKLAAARMDMQKAQRDMADDEAVRGLAAQYGGDENALIKALRGRGMFTQSAALEKQLSDRLTAEATRKKSEVESETARFTLAKNRSDAFERARSALEFDPNLTKDKVHGVLSGMVDQGLLPLETAQRMAANLPDDPEALRADIRRGNLSRISPDKLVDLFAPKTEWKDNGQQLIPVQTNPNAPGYVAPTPIQKMATPGEMMTDQRTREEGAANRGVTMRGQNLVDARAQERLAFDKTKAEDKPLNDTQSKALLFGSRMRESNTVLSELEKAGTTTSFPGARAGYGIGATVNAISSAQQQQLEQAKRDFVNAVLRRESGAVIADSEFANAEKQYFPQIGDSKEVIKQKARNRQLAIDGILAEVPEGKRDSLKRTPQMPIPGEKPKAENGMPADVAAALRRHGG